MDEAVKTRMTRGAAALLALAAGLVHAAAPSSQGLPDPTRPPAAAAPAQAGADAASAAVPQLQSVLVGQTAGERRIAVIDGESVRVGESFRGARVVRIADNEVELLRGRERQVLRLYAPDAGATGMTRVVRTAHRPEKGEQ
jgi:MSHA biogenesis protein MshK